MTDHSSTADSAPLPELPPIRVDLTEAPTDVDDIAPEHPQSNQQTAKRAAQILAKRDTRFYIPSPRQRQDLIAACAADGAVVYGKAFDIVKLPDNVELSADDDIRPHADKIIARAIYPTWSIRF